MGLRNSHHHKTRKMTSSYRKIKKALKRVVSKLNRHRAKQELSNGEAQ